MIVIWKDGVPSVRCKLGEFAMDFAEFDVATALDKLQAWGMRTGDIAAATGIKADCLRKWRERRSTRPSKGNAEPLRRLYAEAEALVAAGERP